VESVDLRKSIGALLRHWKIVVIPAIVAAIVALIVGFIQSPTYEAKVYIAATKLKTQVEFGSAIQTLTEEELAAAGAGALIDRASRLSAFRTLAVTPQIAQGVLPLFEDRLRALDERLLDPARFLEYVSCEESKDSDLIVITVSLSDPQLASDVANAWGQAYAQQINQLYTGVRAQDVENVKQQSVQTYQNYLNAQKELETYLASNPIPRLNQQIDLLQVQIESYQNRLEETRALVSSQELANRQRLLNAYYEDLITLQLLLDDAQALKQQLTLGESSPAAAFGDALALIFLRSRAFAGASIPFSLELQTPLSAESITTSDVENLIQTLETRIAETEAKIEELTATLLNLPKSELPEEASEDIQNRIEELTATKQALEAELAAEEAHLQDLERQRDLAWSTYETLAKKETELQIAVQSGSTEVRVASLSAPPSRPTGPRRLTNTVLAGAVGLMLGAGCALFLEWWQPDEKREN
jgi:uncharacterized protein involved in exopolysaccharide biosynthesis